MAGNVPYYKNVSQVQFEGLPNSSGDRYVSSPYVPLEVQVLLQHPIFQTLDDKYTYLVKIHNELKKFRKGAEKGDKDSIQKMKQFQKFYNIGTNNAWSWKRIVDDQAKHMVNWKGYKEEELFSVSRFGRNFPTHYYEKKQLDCKLVETVGETQNDALLFITNKFQNLFSVLAVFEETVLKQQADTNSSSEPALVGFQERHADGCWVLFEFLQQLQFIYIENGRLVASAVDKSRPDFVLNFIKHTHPLATKNTTVIQVYENWAKITVVPFDCDTLETGSHVQSLKWNVSEWKALPALIIITENIEKALKIHQTQQFSRTIVLLGKGKGKLTSIKETLQSFPNYEYIPSSFKDLCVHYAQQLVSTRKVLLSGKERYLSWVGNNAEHVFKSLDGEVLLDLIDDKIPELFSDQSMSVKPTYSFYIPVFQMEMPQNCLVVTGVPYCGKSTFLYNHSIENQPLTLHINTVDFLHRFFSVRRNDVCASIAAFMSKTVLGEEIIYTFLHRKDKHVLIILDNFEDVVDVEYKNLMWTDCCKDYNDQILRHCEMVLNELKKLSNVTIVVATRSQCLPFLQKSTNHILEHPSLSKEIAKKFVSQYLDSADVPPWISQMLDLNYFSQQLTPTFCQVMKNVNILRTNSTKNVLFDKVKVCHSLCLHLLDKKKGIGKVFSSKEKAEMLYDLNISHVYVAYKSRFPALSMEFLETLFKFGFQEPSITCMDYGLLMFKDSNFEADLGIEEQGISFVDNAFSEFFLAYGVFLLSSRLFGSMLTVWINFTREFIFISNNKHIFSYFKAMLSSEILNEDEINAFKVVLSACRETCPKELLELLFYTMC